MCWEVIKCLYIVVVELKLLIRMVRDVEKQSIDRCIRRSKSNRDNSITWVV